ncbi:MAG TPA: AAA domain-containing protein [Candidatus Dormibacteraeota bacterium]|nr:AAA domain-containing protein [Candidatus Dormibacteraeota bacterium]
MQISDKRRQSVEKARQAWIRQLIDLSRRNNLLYYRPLKWGTLNLSVDSGERWSALLRGESVSVKSLVRDTPDDELTSKALAIWRRSLANQEEKGLATMFVALGMATWKASDGGRDAESPILLLPVALEIKGHAGTSLSIHRTGPAQTNLVFTHVLETEFGVSIPTEQALSLLEGEDEDGISDPSAVYELFRQSCASIQGFETHDAAVLGNFAFQKMAMVQDLQAGSEQLLSSDIVAAISGDTEAKQLIGAEAQNPDPREFDRVPPQSEFLILDADSSQQSAISAVLAGQNAVIHGPPGTGKSQTIANLVASLAAAGKSVLFVAEKRAALQVVLRRLQQVGLEKIVIDLHGADVSPKRVMEQIAAALNAVRRALPVDFDGMHRRYVERRDRLNRHVESLHRRRKPSNMSVYELQGSLLRLRGVAQGQTQWRGSELTTIEKAGPNRIRDLLREAGGLSSLFLRRDPSPWNGVRLQDGAAAQHALDVVGRLGSQTWPAFLESMAATTNAAAFPKPDTLKDARQTFSLFEAVQKTLDSYSNEIFSEDLQAITRALAPARNGRLGAFWGWCTSAEYRRARKRALSHRTAGRTTGNELLAELAAAAEQTARWADFSCRTSTPQGVPGWADACKRLETALADLAVLSSILEREQLGTLPLANISDCIEGLARDRLTPMRLPKLWEVERGLESSGVAKLVEEIRKKKLAPEGWAIAFDYCWYASCLEAAQAEDPEIAGFNGRTHDAFVREFKELDKERIRVAAARVQRACAERAIAAMNENKNEELIIRAEAEKKRRHRPLRMLFSEARHVLTAICPCWMASPLSVSQLLDIASRFDFVVFDEASQVLPEDAIPAIMRASRMVVAGDRWQLPPTTFFAAADEDELADDEKDAATGGYESLLDTTNAFMPSRYLDWHYRSRDEALISFSNHHIYQNRLVTFPGPGGSPVIQHFLVAQQPGLDGQEESCAAEVQKVVDLILEHAENRPTRSLGVIAMGIRHADRVQRALDQALEQRPELGPFFDSNNEERFFVKNLERVQGDERDAIILTVGYGKDRGGNLPFRFGPLLSVGGQRRLNVAVTRARERMTLVSSFSHIDMDLARVKPGTGVELLRHYLEYAASGGKRLGDIASTSFPMNSFEAEVFDVLRSKGVPLLSQVGASNYRIDLVAQHPERPGRCVLAIECDGASYHSSQTARDRDRLRQQQLENLGWKFHRIWSTDWFMRKDEEITRALAAYQSVVAAVDNPEIYSQTSAPIPSSTNPPQAKGQTRGPRPNIPRRETVAGYSERDLMALLNWIESDGRLRTDEEIIGDLLPELGFQRRGARIEEVLKSVLEKYRGQRQAEG